MTSDAPPIACTLSPDAYATRLRDVAALSRDALFGFTRRGTVLDLRYRPEAAARVREMVANERECCAFLHFELREGAGEVTLRVTAPAAAAESVAELVTHFTER